MRGKVSINKIERRKGREGGRGKTGIREQGTCPKVTQQVRGKARTKALFPQNSAASPRLRGGYQSRNLHSALPRAPLQPRKHMERRMTRNALINRHKEGQGKHPWKHGDFPCSPPLLVGVFTITL